MRRVAFAWVIVIGVSTAVVGEVAAPNDPALPQAITTRQTLFSIPFQVEQAADPASKPVEVRLYVSTNRGTHWMLYDRVDPARRQFLFRAVTDGEYCFLIRTLDQAGKIRPEEATRPGLRVIVDTALPELELQAKQGDAGQVLLGWRATDLNLDLDSLRIQHRASPGLPWQPVAVDREDMKLEGKWRSGEVIWWPEQSSDAVEIRAELADRAGNAAVSHARVALHRESRPASDLTAARSPGSAGGPKESPAVEPSWQPSAEAPGTASQPTEVPAREGNAVDSPPTGVSSRANSVAHGPAADSQSTHSPPAGELAEEALPTDGWQRASDAKVGGRSEAATANRLAESEPSASKPSASKQGTAEPETPGIGEGSPWNPNQRMVADVHPPIRRRYLALEEPGPEPTAEGKSAVYSNGEAHADAKPNVEPHADTRPKGDDRPFPAKEKPRMLNSRRFELEYETRPGSESAAGEVEVWGTRDGGQTWSSFGIDADRSSPVLVTVPEEGVYGFSIVIGARTDPGIGKPRSGDSPDLWIGVDITRPTARILSAQRQGERFGRQLLIRWEASDSALVGRPISLFYSPTPGGPWTPIVWSIENHREHAWSTGDRLPQHVFLRLEVRDEAGNLGTFETLEPVALDSQEPGTPIRGVRPVAESARLSGSRYRVR